MLRTFVTATIMGAATLALVGAAAAQVVVPKEQEFYATPIQKGAPVDLPGERLVPGAVETARALDVVISPIVVVPSQQLGTAVGAPVGATIAALPIIGTGMVLPGAEAAPAAGPVMRHRHHHHHHARHGVRYRKVARAK